MKKRLFWLIIPAAFFALGGCEKKNEVAKPDPATEQVTATSDGTAPAEPTPTAASETKPAAPVVPVVSEVKPLSAAERAAKHGFARYLPADTESVITVHNGGKIGERTQNLKLWKVIEEQVGSAFGMGPQPMRPPGMEMEGGEDFAIPDAEDGDAPVPTPAPAPPADGKEDTSIPRANPRHLASNHVGNLMLVTADGPDPGSEEAAQAVARVMEAAGDPVDEEEIEEEMADPFNPVDMLGLEVTVATGKSTSENLTHLFTAYERFYYFFMRGASRAFAASVKEGDLDSMDRAMQDVFGEQLAKNLLNDPESGIGLIERAKMPPIYVAFRTTKENQQSVADTVGQAIDQMGQMGEVSEAVTIEKAGAKLTGHKIVGSKIVEEMASEREEMENTLGVESTEKLLAVIGKKTLVVASGTIGDYVMIFVGSSEEDFGLIEDPVQSLASSEALAFADAYADKELAVLVYGGKSLIESMLNGVKQMGLGLYANGIRDGLSGAEGLGETRDLEAMLQMVAEREAALYKLASSDATGMLAFFDQGLHIESFGGMDGGAIDYQTPCKLAHLGDSPDVAVFINASADAAYDEKALAYYEAIVETAYAAAVKFSELPIEDTNVQQFKETLEMFNQNFRADALTLWDALRGDLGAGLGQESALVVDLKGSMPTFPGLPQAVVDSARFPRATLIMPVTDRAKLKSSWTKINGACTELLGKISEMSGEDIPMQKPISSEKDGYTTWFMSLPFQSNDFIPSVTVGDKWFAAATSKDRALELLGQAEQGGAERTGLWLRVDFTAFQTCAAETLKMLDENAKEIFGDNESNLNQFTSSKELRDQMLDAMTDLDSLTVHSRRENGVLRGSIHFKTR